jgi:hypothetical protein
MRGSRLKRGDRKREKIVITDCRETNNGEK